MPLVRRKYTYLRLFESFARVQPKVNLPRISQQSACCYSGLQAQFKSLSKLESLLNYCSIPQILSASCSSKGGGSSTGRSISDSEDSPVKGGKRRRKRAISDSDDDSRYSMHDVEVLLSVCSNLIGLVVNNFCNHPHFIYL